MWRPTLDICRPSLGAPRAWYPGTVLWALGAELTLTPPSALPPGASLALGPTCGGRGCPLRSLDRAGLPSSRHRGPWQGHLDLRLLCPVSHFLFGRGPCLSRKRPTPLLGWVTEDTFQLPVFSGEP